MTATKTKQAREPSPEPQVVRWGPVDLAEPGIRVEGADGSRFVEWNDLKKEVETKLLPQVRVVPIGSSVDLQDFDDRKNWVVAILNPDGQMIGHVWFGTDADNKWQWDGLVRLGDPERISRTDKLVWQTFQRYSDGSYRRIEATLITPRRTTKKSPGFL